MREPRTQDGTSPTAALRGCPQPERPAMEVLAAIDWDGVHEVDANATAELFLTLLD